MKSIRWLFLLLAFLLLIGAAFPALAAKPLKVGASGAVLMDAATKRVLFAQDAHTRLPMASTTKIMTALIALETSALDTLVTVPKEAYGTEGSSIYLNNGEKITVEDLLYGLMLSSGNDAAVTLAVYIGGSVEGFAQIMNNRAKEIGCANTNFVTPNGLHDPNHYTSAYDLALISSVAMQNEDFRRIVSTKYWKTTSGDIVRTFKNKNKILWQYEGGNGIKTGFTKTSGRCLAFSAERGGHTVVGVVLNCPDMWNDAKAMLDYGFTEYAWKPYVKAGDTVATFGVDHGMKNSLEIRAKEDILIPMRQDEPENAVTLKVVGPKTVKAPVYEGQAVGMLEAWGDGKRLYAVPLVASETVLRKEYPYFLWEIAREWTA
ncbi:MAG TPA: D-alanyl-D-alanine carboxypeptidase family protein [Feifaniaceae bacterium]|nr:D-alanyl-D-alanine carboxypeptidase family protein [Feifaniaceae bacterium]